MDQEGVVEMEESTLKPAPDVGVRLKKLGKTVIKYVKQGRYVVLKPDNEVKTHVFHGFQTHA